MTTMVLIDFDLIIDACSFSCSVLRGRITGPSTTDRLSTVGWQTSSVSGSYLDIHHQRIRGVLPSETVESSGNPLGQY
jgi:hypothetical protein